VGANAQNWAVKPFVGIHYNTIKEKTGDKFIFSIPQEPIPCSYGVFVAYQFNPKWGGEIGIKRTVFSVNLDVVNPITVEKAGYFNDALLKRNFVASGNYALYDNQKWIRIKAYGGFEDIRNRRSQSARNAAVDTSVLKVSEIRLRYNLSDQFYINMGIGCEFLV
jgi:hypothetical protein